MYGVSACWDEPDSGGIGAGLLLGAMGVAAEEGNKAWFPKRIVGMCLLSSAGGRRALGLWKADKDDPDLLRAVQAGDGRAISRVLEEYIPRIGRYLTGRYGLPADELEDVLQEVRVAFLEAAPRFRGTCGLRTYLTQIACRKCVDLLRAKSRRAAESYELDEGHMEADCADPEQSVPDRLSLQEALAQLSPRQREVVMMYHCEGRSYSDISEDLGIAIGTVAATKAEALQRLRRFLTDVSAGSAEDSG